MTQRKRWAGPWRVVTNHFPPSFEQRVAVRAYFVDSPFETFRCELPAAERPVAFVRVDLGDNRLRDAT